MSRLASKNHFYPFTLRSANLSGATMCTDRIIMYLVPPKDALTIENMFCHFKLTFDSGVSVGDRVLKSIGICNEVPLFVDTEPDYLRKLDLNVAADGDRIVDVKLDLTTLLNKNNAQYREYFETPATDDFTYVIIQLDESLRTNVNVGTINIWKLDGLFTTKGIR